MGLWIPFPDTVGKTLSFTCLGYQNINAQVDSPELSGLVPRGHGNRSQSIGCCWGPTGEVSGKVDVPMKSWEFLAKNWDVPPKNGFLGPGLAAWHANLILSLISTILSENDLDLHIDLHLYAYTTAYTLYCMIQNVRIYNQCKVIWVLHVVGGATWCCKIILSIGSSLGFSRPLYTLPQDHLWVSVRSPALLGLGHGTYSIYTKSFPIKNGQYDSKLLTPLSEKLTSQCVNPFIPPPHLGMKIKFAGKMPPRHQKCHPQRRPTASAFATMASKRGFKASCGSVGSFPCAWGKASKITSWISWYKQWKIPIYIFLSWCSHQKPPWLLMTPW